MSKATTDTVQALYNHRGKGQELLNKWVADKPRHLPPDKADKE